MTIMPWGWGSSPASSPEASAGNPLLGDLRKQALLNGLLGFGSQLLSGSGWGGGVRGFAQGTQQGMSNAMQSALVMDRLSERKRQREREEQWNKDDAPIWNGVPEQQREALQAVGYEAGSRALANSLTQRPDLPSAMEGYQWALRNGQIPPGTSYLQWEKMQADATRAPQQPRQPTMYDQRLNYYSNTLGLSPEQAQGHAVGRYQSSRDPISGRVQVIDMVTGQPVQAASSGGAPAPASSVTQTTNGGQGGLLTSNRAEPYSRGGGGAAVSTNVAQAEPSAPDPTQATGMSGVYGNVANWAADLAGMEIPYPEVDAAGRALSELKADIITTGSAEVPGRPSDFARQLEGVNTVEPFSIGDTDQRSLNKLRQTRESIVGEMRRMEGLLEDANNYTPKQVSDTRQNLGRMQGIVQRLDQLINAAGRAGEQPGGNAEIDSLVDKYAPAGGQ